MQRIWRTYHPIVSSQLGLLVLQFDRLVRTKRSVDAFLSPEEKKVWMGKVGQKLLELAHASSRDGLREAQKGDAKKGKGGGKKGGKGDDDDGGGGGGGGSILQIDFDVKMLVLSRGLRDRKREFNAKLFEYRAELAAAAQRKEELLEMQRAKEMFMVGKPANAEGDGDGDGAPAAAEEEGPKKPRFRLLLTQEQLLPLIAEALMETADRIHAGLPIDAAVSVTRAIRRQASTAAADADQKKQEADAAS